MYVCVSVYTVCVVWLVAAPVVHVELQGAYADTFHLYMSARLMSRSSNPTSNSLLLERIGREGGRRTKPGEREEEIEGEGER